MASLAPKPSTVSLGQRLWNALSAWTIKASGYQKIGLRQDDLYLEDLPEVKEAIRRLPEQELYLRHFRIKRALDLSLKHSLLPQEQWTKPEEDVHYLRPYIEAVKAEMEERKLWNKKQ